MCSFTMKPSMNSTSAAFCAEDSSARAARSFNRISSLIDIRVLMSIFVIILLGLILISADLLIVGVIGAIILSLSLIIESKFIPHRERTVHS